MPPSAHESRSPKYRQVYDVLLDEIRSGRLRGGDRLPSEAALEKRFGASRITVGRAVRELQLAGFVDRRAGAGTFVRRPSTSSRAPRLFGVVAPEAGETEIFDPILRAMTSVPGAPPYALLYGSVASDEASKDERALDLCRQYIDRGVAGVFFAPIELTPSAASVNREVVDRLDRARIPVVLLDRAVEPYPARSRHDVIGIDNRRAGYIMTTHLLAAGSRRLAFFGQPNAASTVEARLSGYREAVLMAGYAADASSVVRADPGDVERVRALVLDERPDGIVCANDRTAAVLMRVLLDLGVRIPGEVRLVGIDDLDYAGLLPIPLTTLRQPVREIGMAAVSALSERVAQPQLPPRDIFLHPTLVVRRSCGTGSRGAALD